VGVGKIGGGGRLWSSKRGILRPWKALGWVATPLAVDLKKCGISECPL
jgi:hypothetical protein